MSRRDEFNQVAKTTPFDNSSNGFASTDVQGAIEELSRSSSPGFTFGRSGTATSGTFLQCETVPSNVSGRWVYVANGTIQHVYVSNELLTTYTIEVLYHDGNSTNLTSVGSVTVTSARGAKFDVNWPIPINKQVAVRVATGSANFPKNIVCGLEIMGAS